MERSGESLVWGVDLGCVSVWTVELKSKVGNRLFTWLRSKKFLLFFWFGRAVKICTNGMICEVGGASDTCHRGEGSSVNIENE